MLSSIAYLQNVNEMIQLTAFYGFIESLTKLADAASNLKALLGLI